MAFSSDIILAESDGNDAIFFGSIGRFMLNKPVENSVQSLDFCKRARGDAKKSRNKAFH